MENPDHPGYLLVASQLHDKTKRLTLAYQFAKRVTDLAPQVAEGWLNLGRVNDELYRFKDAHDCYAKALERCKRPELRALILVNLSGLSITEAKWTEAEKYARLALTIDPTHRKGHANLGTACLAQGKWREGWEGYSHILGLDNRRLVSFSGESQWDGTTGKSIVIYGEQGLGDEICFASMFWEAVRDSSKVVVECDPKLQGLFQRSFPTTTVYGTRWKKEINWRPEDQKPDASISSAALANFYRKSTDSFPREPFLKADPDRVAMWKAFVQRQGRPVIGIAWSGGVQWTAEKFRRIPLEAFCPLFEAIDAVYISLQYKDATDEIAAFKAKHPGIDIRQYPTATLTADYDDTAGLVAALDCVVGPPTAVIHLAGALGAPTVALHSPLDCWKYASGLLWHPATMIPHNQSWSQTIRDAIPKITEHLC